MGVHIHFQDLWKLQSEIPSSDMIVIIFDSCMTIKTGGHDNLELCTSVLRINVQRLSTTINETVM